MIELDKYEKQWILLIKGHLQNKYPFTGNWVDNLKPLFKEIYGWDPDEDNNYRDYLHGMFTRLLEILLKIKDKWTDPNQQLKDVFDACFYKRLGNDYELPIERGISKMCGIIQCTTVLNPDKSPRFKLF